MRRLVAEKKEKKKSDQVLAASVEREWLISTQLVGYLVTRGEYESSLVIMERLIRGGCSYG
jgi:hypothetical protein